MNTLLYRAGYKYQTAAPFEIELPILPPADVSNRFIKLDRKGLLSIREDYSWDGASGVTLDDSTNMRPSLVHDALYQLLRDGLLDAKYRGVADRIFYNLLKKDGMSPERAMIYFQGVSQFGKPYADPRSERPILKAPTNLKDES